MPPIPSATSMFRRNVVNGWLAVTFGASYDFLADHFYLQCLPSAVTVLELLGYDCADIRVSIVSDFIKFMLHENLHSIAACSIYPY